MVNKFISITLFAIIISFIMACGGKSSNTTKDMSDFSEEKSFKDAHDSPKDIDAKLTNEMVTFPTPDGKEGSAYMIKSKTDSDKYLFVIHEWWGLNDNIKQEAERYAEALGDVNVMALDIYDGNVAEDPDDASRFMKAVKEDRAEAIVKGALAMAGENAKIGTIGWCFGGGWSLKSALMAGERADACVIYYGMPVNDAKQLATLDTDVLGIWADKDQWITPEVAKKFGSVMKATGKKFISHSFDADHAFANPSSERYVEAAATEANKIALEYLKARL